MGAILKNCVVVTMVERIHKMTYNLNPELFGVQFLSNVGVVEQKGGVLQFYEVTRPGSQPAGANKKKSK